MEVHLTYYINNKSNIECPLGYPFEELPIHVEEDCLKTYPSHLQLSII